MDQFKNLDRFVNHVNSAVDAFTCLEFTSEKHEAIQLLQSVIKTFESSLTPTNNEQKFTVNVTTVSPDSKYGYVRNLTMSQNVGKLTCQNVEESTYQDETHRNGMPSSTSDVLMQEPGIQQKFIPQGYQKKDKCFMGENTTSMQSNMFSRLAKDVLEMRKLTKENDHLKDELWKLVSVNSEHLLVTPGGDGGTTTIIRDVLEELISKAVFYAELSRGPVEVVDFVQTHLVMPIPVIAKRKRGRPPKNKLLSPEVRAPPAGETTRGGRRRKAQRITGQVECLTEEEGVIGKERKTTQVAGTKGAKQRKMTGKHSASVLEDCTRRDVKTEVFPSGGITTEVNADSDTTVIYDDATDFDTLTQKQRAMKRKQKLKTKHRLKMLAMPARHKCEICRAAFSHGRPFKRHLLKHGDGDTSCRRCHDEFQNYALFLHHQCQGDPASRVRRGIEQKCSVCDETFHNQKKLQHHVNTAHGRTLDPVFFCEYCDKGFVKRASLYVHYKQHAEGQHVCNKCGHFFEDETALSTHENTHLTSGNYACKKCEETFSSRQQYLQHVAGHKKYDCLMCGQTFATSKMLDVHNKEVHGVELKSKTYGCDYCGKKYPRPGLLELHLRTHTGEKPLECVACCLFFRTPKALYRHRQTFSHMERTGQSKKERSHLCSTCGRSYFRKQALDRHMRYHSGVKPYQCPHCSYKTREHNNLKRHVALHFSRRDFICETCGDAFHAKKTLEVHVLYKHSDERPLQCTDCDMTFKTKNSLKRHRLIHQNLRLHKCAICEMSFNRFYNLRRHMRMVHGTEDSLPAPNKVRVLDAPAGQEYRRPYRPPIKQPSRFVDATPPGGGSHQLTRNPTENSIGAGLSMDCSAANQKQYMNLVPSTPGGASLVQLQPVIRHVPTITPSMLPQVNYVPISAAIGDARGGTTVTVAHQLVGVSTMTTLQGLYPHPSQPLVHPQASPRQPTEPASAPPPLCNPRQCQQQSAGQPGLCINGYLLQSPPLNAPSPHLMHPPWT